MPGEYRARIQMGSGGHGAKRPFEAIESGQAPSAEAMRQLRRLHAGAVTVVTTATEQGYRGITVSAFSILSLDPPRILVCLTRGGEGLETVQAAGGFAVSVLSDTQEFLAEQFAGRAPLVNRRFDGVKSRLTAGGRPVLEAALVWFDCAIAAIHDGGDHLIVVGEVNEAGYGTGTEPLLYFDGQYRSFEIG